MSFGGRRRASKRLEWACLGRTDAGICHLLAASLSGLTVQCFFGKRLSPRLPEGREATRSRVGCLFLGEGHRAAVCGRLPSRSWHFEAFHVEKKHTFLDGSLSNSHPTLPASCGSLSSLCFLLSGSRQHHCGVHKLLQNWGEGGRAEPESSVATMQGWNRRCDLLPLPGVGGLKVKQVPPVP